MWKLILIFTPVFVGWGLLWFSVGFNRGWKAARKWGSP